MTEIAIIEDNAQLLNHLRKLINEQEGFCCTISESRIGTFFEQLQLLHPPDILVLGIFLRNASMLEHLNKLKLLLPATKLMIHSDHTEDEFLIEAFTRGVNAFLRKDCSSRQFIDTLKVLRAGEDFIDPTLSGKVINIFKNEFRPAGRSGIRTAPFNGLLNSREHQVVKGLVKGHQYKEIAAELYLSINTIRHYVKSIYRKFEVNNKVQLFKKLQEDYGFSAGVMQ